MGRGVADRSVRTCGRIKRCVVNLPFEQPVVGLEPDRSDPRMRLKQNWSFHAEGVGRSEAGDQWSEESVSDY